MAKKVSFIYLIIISKSFELDEFYDNYQYFLLYLTTGAVH